MAESEVDNLKDTIETLRKRNEELQEELEEEKRKNRRNERILQALGDLRMSKFKMKHEDVLLISRIGKGGFGEVWKGEWSTNKDIAVKLVRIPALSQKSDEQKSALDAIIREFEVQVKLVHNNIVEVFGYSKHENEIRIYMELMNMNLWQYLMMKKPSLLEKLYIMRNIVVGLQYLHSCTPAVIHRDIKCANILISKNGDVVKITDFGLVETITSVESFAEVDHHAGTRKYMAPELLASDDDQTFKCSKSSDVYALGITFYEILFEDDPYPGGNNLFIMEKVVIKEERPSLKVHYTKGVLPEELENLLKSMWVTDPKKRPIVDDVLMTLNDIIHIFKSRSDLHFPRRGKEEEAEGEREDEDEEKITKKKRKEEEEVHNETTEDMEERTDSSDWSRSPMTE